jgi:23S rRNA pseudouridine1911/1915/1917 synthase
MNDGDITQEIFEITIVSEDSQFRRLDLLLASKIDKLSRSSLQKLFELELVTDSDGKNLGQSKIPPVGTKVQVLIPPPAESELVAANIPLKIFFEDEHLIILHKPQGMVVHPAPGNWKDTLVNALLFHCPNLPGIGHTKRPGIVHRLDKGTSGVMVAAKSAKAHEKLVDMFKAHNLVRKYEALTVGPWLQNIGKNEGDLESFIERSPVDRKKMTSKTKQGKWAKTHFHRLKSFKHFIHHMEFQLYTGRTHQIRVHCSELLKIPIINDITYGYTKKQKEQLTPLLSSHLPILEGLFESPHPFLHAKHLSFTHPITQEELSYSAPPPENWQDAISLIYS